MKMKRLDQSKLSFGKGRGRPQDEKTERKRKSECDGDERGRAGTAHCAQNRITIMSLCCLKQAKLTNQMTFRQYRPYYHRDICSLVITVEFSNIYCINI